MFATCSANSVQFSMLAPTEQGKPVSKCSVHHACLMVQQSCAIQLLPAVCNLSRVIVNLVCLSGACPHQIDTARTGFKALCQTYVEAALDGGSVMLSTQHNPVVVARTADKQKHQRAGRCA